MSNFGSVDELHEEVNSILRRFVQYSREIDELQRATSSAFHAAQTMSGALTEVFGEEFGAVFEKHSHSHVEVINRASQSLDRVLNAHLAMGLWSAFDATIEDIVVAIVARNPEAIPQDIQTSKKISFADALKLDTRALAEEFVAATVRIGPGTGRVDSLLRLVGLYVQVPEITKYRILELGVLRNIIAHRGSVVDRKAIAQCSWLGLEEGDRVSISNHALGRYSLHLLYYVIEAAEAFMRSIDLSFPSEARAVRSEVIKMEKMEKMRGQSSIAQHWTT